MTVLIIATLLLIIIGLIAFGIFLIKAERKKFEQTLQEYKNNEKVKNEQKESMETGNSVDDFNQSVNILHQYAKNK